MCPDCKTSYDLGAIDKKSYTTFICVLCKHHLDVAPATWKTAFKNKVSIRERPTVSLEEKIDG